MVFFLFFFLLKGSGGHSFPVQSGGFSLKQEQRGALTLSSDCSVKGLGRTPYVLQGH